eukprot:Skav204628  [mRNA]  locus=scaffold1712:294496:298403:- [translate_table: standard]
MDGERSVQVQWFLSLVVAILALLTCKGPESKDNAAGAVEQVVHYGLTPQQLVIVVFIGYTPSLLNEWGLATSGYTKIIQNQLQIKHQNVSSTEACALHDQLGMCLPRDSVEKMKAAATELVGTGEDEMLEKLCRCISQSAAPPKPRHVVSLAKDLSRRLASEKLLGGQEPGATEALELLLNAILMKLEMEEPGAPFMLALQVLANCFQQAVVGEALLPVVVEMMTMPVWQALWLSSRQPDKPLDRARDAAATLLLNASVMLRGAKLRASHRPLLRHSIAALKVMPQDERVNWAVGNLLAMGGGPDDAKETLQAQPRSSLRMLAAAIFHGQLDGPEGAAFPDVWHPPDSGAPPGGAPGGGPGDPGRRPRAPIPGRYRRRGGG